MEETNTTVTKGKQEDFFDTAVPAFLNTSDSTGARDVLRQLNFKLPDDGAEETATEQPITAPEEGETTAEATTPDLGTLAKILMSDSVREAYRENDYSETAELILKTIVSNVPTGITVAAMCADNAMSWIEESWVDKSVAERALNDLESKPNEEVCESLLEESDDPASLVNGYVQAMSHYGCLFEYLAKAIQDQAESGESAPRNGTSTSSGTES